jgi:hypothetical protein
LLGICLPRDTARETTLPPDVRSLVSDADGLLAVLLKAGIAQATVSARCEFLPNTTRPSRTPLSRRCTHDSAQLSLIIRQ